MRKQTARLAVVFLVVGIASGCAALVASASFDRAVTAFERGDYQAAIAHLEGTLRSGVDSARVRTLLGWSFYKTGELARAKAEFERALRMDRGEPNAFYVHEGLGWIAYKTGDHDRAIAAFTESLRLNPGYHNAHDGLGWSYLAKRNFMRAEANFKAVLERVAEDLDARRGLGFVAYHRGEWDKAIERFRDVLRRNEADSVTRSALGWAHYYKTDYAGARQVFQDVAHREPTWADPLVGLAWIAERQGRREEAKTGFKLAIEKSAAYVAIVDLRKLLAGRPEWLDLWHELGWALYHQRAFAHAETEFRALLERHPKDADGLRGLGFTLYALRRFQEAIPPLQRSLALGVALPPVRERVEIPGAPGLHQIVSDAASTLAWSHYHAGELKPAVKLFREVTARHPDWVDPWSGLGWALLKHGDRKGAEEAFQRSLRLEPRYPDALSGLQRLGKQEQ